MSNVLNIRHFKDAKHIGSEAVIDFENPLNSKTIVWYELPGGTYIATEKDGSFNRAVRTDPRSNLLFLAVED